MAALFDDAAAVQDDEAVHRGDGGEAVRDGDDGFALHQLVQALLDGGFDFAVQRRGGLVQDEYRRVFEEDAGDGNALPLAAGEFDAALAHLRVQSGVAALVGEVGDEVGCLGLCDGVL